MDTATLTGGQPAFVLSTHSCILVVCPVRLLRDGLVDALETEASLRVVARACGGEEALAQLGRPPPPDIVLIDAAVPQGPALLLRVREADPSVGCVAFGTEDAPEAAAPWAEAGATVVVSRRASLADLIRVLKGMMPAERHGEAAPDFWRPMRPGPPLRLLTRRERQILDQIRVGRSNKEIARCLGIEPATVKCHVHNLLAKLKVRRRGEAAVWRRGHAGEMVRW
jgi:DNA-binding NarL/FixJ family response regulator